VISDSPLKSRSVNVQAAACHQFGRRRHQLARPPPPPTSAGKDGVHRYVFNVYPGRLKSPTVRQPFDIDVFDRQAKVAGSTEFNVRPRLHRS
jgi:phosphatidylethanolamine-binding protein (PEBP) family uncharacterized protein